ncbi:hypothetical protein BaRGS_00014868 [Batillaria attramentaria]|uniref:Contactin n=1 Tax=Batillaria attramentaria TaxID=370345 RepID=A0ABD0L417_9CAEN
MRVSVLLTLLVVTTVRCQVSFTECPTEWIKNGDHCYRFVGYPRLKLNGASSFCQNDGAALLSVNSPTEHTFVVNWLETYDAGRDTWLTSGVVTTQGVQWLGDGTSTSSLNFWLDTASERKDGDTVGYVYSNVTYEWGIADDSKNSSFVCEIALADIYKIVEDDRDFDYGLEIENPDLAPKGPKFLAEPVDTTILSATTAAYLDCLATGIPKPEYSWLRSSGNTMAPLRTGPGTRYSLTGGRLTIDFPVEADEGTYQCVASNEFGSILSTPVTLSFGSLGEFSNVPTADVYGELYDGAVIECPSINYRPAVSYQWFKNDITSFIRPEVQDHTFISNNGKLYFSELASSDDAIYYCVVSLTSQGGTGNYIGASRDESRTSLGFRLHVTSGGNSQFQPVIQNDFIKVYPGNPKRGQTIEMECFAQGTGPLVYIWYRDGKEMPRTASFSETKRVMRIENVQIEDGGQYRCRVDSRTTNLFAEKNYTLDIQAEPYFSYPLTDQHVDLGSKLTWHCEARGKPTPTYTWYKNGQVLQNSTGVRISGNTMVIDSLQRERDSGMYQCAARNLYGVSFSSAQIRVLEFAPTFAKRPVEAFLSAAVGGDITIVCDPEAAPAPTYKWLRNGADLGLVQGGSANNGFQMLLNGNLFIENINTGHQGTYTCQVTNSLGEASSEGILRVFPRTVISQRPRNEQVEVNTTAALTCTTSSPPNIDVVYVWFFNNHLIDLTDDIEYRMGSGATSGNLYIIGAQYKHEGRYTCQVTTAMDSVKASAFLTVRGPPGEPAGVYKGDNVGDDVDEVDESEASRAIRIYWSDGETHGSNIVAYSVEFRTNFDMRWRFHPGAQNIDARLVQSNEYSDKKTFFLRNLKPWAGHQFRVRAINSFGLGAPSKPTEFIQIPGARPTVAPSGVSGGGGKVGDLTVTWEPLPEEDHNGPNLKYNVYYREKQRSVTSDTRWEQATVLPSEACAEIPDTEKGLVLLCRHTFLVGKQFYYMPYEVRLEAENVYGKGVSSDIVTIMSAEEMPTGTPRAVFSIPYNSTALEVHWTPVPNTREQMKGKLIGYRINYWDKDLEEEEQARFNIIPVPPGSDNVDHGLIIGLVPGHWYISNVQSITSAGFGPKSENYPQETANFAPSLYPTEVHVYSVEGVGLRVNFRGISTKVAEEPLMGYKMQYWPSGENIRSAQVLDVGRLNYGTITNVSESVLYQLRVFGYSRGGQGKRSSPSVYFTVGEGQVAYNPETTEVMAGCSMVQASLLFVCITLLLNMVMAQHQLAEFHPGGGKNNYRERVCLGGLGPRWNTADKDTMNSTKPTSISANKSLKTLVSGEDTRFVWISVDFVLQDLVKG